MPHLILEYAEAAIPRAEVPALLAEVHEVARATGLFTESRIKVRARPVADYLTGGERRPFVHAELRIRAGRSPEERKRLAEAVLAILRARLAGTVLTAEVVEMDPAAYARYYPDPEEEAP
jgi:5-carboxymethyl-2-hydroxymuconate isomerase